MERYLFSGMHSMTMEESASGNADRTTWRHVGMGLLLMGSLLLLLTLVFFVMSIFQVEYYSLFHGGTHLAFDIVLGSAMIALGLALSKKRVPAPEASAGSNH
jgi:hypothetical protein